MKGEDWGSIIANYLAQFYPERVNGIHITMPIADDSNLKALFYLSLSGLFPNLLYSEEEIKFNVPHRYSLKSRIGVVLKDLG